MSQFYHLQTGILGQVFTLAVPREDRSYTKRKYSRLYSEN